MGNEMIFFLCMMSDILLFMIAARFAGREDFFGFALAIISMTFLTCAVIMLDLR